jgi:hypothetical protein
MIKCIMHTCQQDSDLPFHKYSEKRANANDTYLDIRPQEIRNLRQRHKVPDVC